MSLLTGASSLRQTLVRVTMLSVAVALALSMICAAVYELVSARSRTREEITVLADVIAANSTAPLAFQDRKAAGEALATLRADSRVVSAVLSDRDGFSLARYRRQPGPGSKDDRSRAGLLYLSRPVLLDGAPLGSVELVADLSEVGARLLRYALLMTLVAAGSCATAYLLSSRLQRVISGPIQELAETAEVISNRKDYSLRVLRKSPDEVGQLIDRFNEMVSQIEIRDMALQRARGELERRVRERTRELEHQVAERTRAEEALADQAEALARSNADLQQFAYVASHDLQEPLRMVASYLQLIARRYQGRLDSDADEFIDFAVGGARRMQDLIADLLAYSRVGTQAKALQRVDTERAFGKAVENLKVAIDESGAVVTRSGLPAVWADPVQIVQLFQNLIGNAIKFRGQRRPEVRVEAETRDDATTFRIRDNGIGIEPQYADRIFVIFQRLHTREEYGGNGIGLAVCKKIVERHRGRIWMESNPGQGSTFSFTIATPPQEAEAAGPASAVAAMAGGNAV